MCYCEILAAYQLSQKDPRDALPHLQRAVHGGGMFSATGQARRSSVDLRKYCQLSTDRRRPLVYLAPSVCLWRTTLTTPCDDRRAVMKFSKVWVKVRHIFVRPCVSLQHSPPRIAGRHCESAGDQSCAIHQRCAD